MYNRCRLFIIMTSYRIEPIPSVVEAIRSSSPFSTTSTLERNKNRHSGFYPDCGDITLG